MKTIATTIALLAFATSAHAQSVWQQRSPTHYGAPGYNDYQAQQQMVQQQNQQLMYDMQRQQQLQQMQNAPAYHSRGY